MRFSPMPSDAPNPFDGPPAGQVAVVPAGNPFDDTPVPANGQSLGNAYAAFAAYDSPLVKDFAPMVARVGSGILGMEGGGPGFLFGAGGESLAQLLEQGKIYSPARVGTQGAITAIPLSGGLKTADMALNAAKLGLANAGATTIDTLADEGRLPTAEEVLKSAGSGVAAPIIGAAGAKTIGKAGQVLGVVPEDAAKALASWKAENPDLGKLAPELTERGATIPASVTNPEGTAKMTKFAGSGGPKDSGAATINKIAATKNQPWANDFAKKIIGIPDAPVLDQSAFDLALDRALVPYKKIASMSPEAAQEFTAMRDNLQMAGRAKQSYYNQGSAGFNLEATKQAAERYEATASQFESSLIQRGQDFNRAFVAQNNPGLEDTFDAMQAARTKANQLQTFIAAGGSGTGHDSAVAVADAQKQLVAANKEAQENAAQLDQFVQQAGLRNPMDDAPITRVKLAQIGKLQAATNQITGDVDVRMLAGMRKSPSAFNDLVLGPDGRPVMQRGDLSRLADAGEAFPQLFPSKTPTVPEPHGSPVKGAAAGALFGSVVGHPEAGAIAGAAIGGKGVGMLKQAARDYITSPKYITKNQFPNFGQGLSDGQKQMLNLALMRTQMANQPPSTSFLQSVSQ